MNQVLLGASIPFILGIIVYACRRFRASMTLLIVMPLSMLFLALYAVAPDLPRLFRMQALYARLSLDPRMDVFLWHYTIDMTESDSNLYAVGLVLMLACLLLIAWREVLLREDKREASRGT